MKLKTLLASGPGAHHAALTAYHHPDERLFYIITDGSGGVFKLYAHLSGYQGVYPGGIHPKVT